MSPDTVSSLFPDRPIRPLPKRKLRERLLPNATHPIKYPSSTEDGISLSYHSTPSTTVRVTAAEMQGSTSRPIENRSLSNLVLTNSHRHHLSDGESSFLEQRQEPERGNIKFTAQTASGAEAQQTFSASSSIDGYDTLENASNKKKRKIPSATDNALRSLQSIVSSPNKALQSRTAIENLNYIPPTDCASTGTLPMHIEGMSGSGRGRLCRSESIRSPVGTIFDGDHIWPGCKTGGIISNAIANAEKLSSPGQENRGSLLGQRSASRKSMPMTSQFTFTFESQMPSIVSWPDALPNSHTALEDTPIVPSKHSSSVPSDVSVYPKVTRGKQQRAGGRKCRSLERKLALAARDRKQVAANNYYRSPPKLEDIWVCEFCEYERIFGCPPKALIREYELKDRRLRQEEADRRRLMEKAKAKGKKGRRTKSAKGNQPVSHSPEPALDEQAVDEGDSIMETEISHSAQPRRCYGDEFDKSHARTPSNVLGLYGKNVDKKG